jgi:hypothetical protein
MVEGDRDFHQDRYVTRESLSKGGPAA